MSRRRRNKNGAYGTNLRVIEATYNANRIDSVWVASDKSNSLTKLVNEDREGDADIQENVSATYTANGTYEVLPWPNKDGMEKATVTVDVPIEEHKDVTIDVSTYTDPIEIVPMAANVAIEGATVTLNNIPVMPEIESNKSSTIDVAQYAGPVEITPTEGKDAMEKATIALTNIPAIENNKAATIDVSTYDDSNRPVITPDTGFDGIEQATIALTNIPIQSNLESNKAATIDISTYDPDHKPVIVPSTGYDGMKQATITLDNIPYIHQEGVFQLDLSNPQSTVTPDGYDFQIDSSSAMYKAHIVVKNRAAYLYEWRYGSGTNMRTIYTAGIPPRNLDGLNVTTIQPSTEVGLIVATDTSSAYHYDAIDANKYITLNGRQYNFTGEKTTISQKYGV